MHEGSENTTSESNQRQKGKMTSERVRWTQNFNGTRRGRTLRTSAPFKREKHQEMAGGGGNRVVKWIKPPRYMETRLGRQFIWD